MLAIAGGIVLAILFLSVLPDLLMLAFAIGVILCLGLGSLWLLGNFQPLLFLLAIGAPALILGYIGKRVLSYHGKERREALIGVVLCAPIVAPAMAVIVFVVRAIVQEGLPALLG